MKCLLLLAAFAVLTSCGANLPQSFYKKSLTEENYVENSKNNYSLYFNANTTDAQVHIQLVPDAITWQPTADGYGNTALLAKQLHRPYFTITSGTDTLTVANRHIYFKEVVNFRDIGGLKTTEGKTVKWGKIFRSDNLSNLKASEFSKFNDLNIKTVFDLRTNHEIKGKEDNLPTATEYIHFPTLEDNEDLLSKMRARVINGEVSDEQSLNLMLDLYRSVISDNIPSLKKLIHQIVDSNDAVLYHCSAGKDRTGVVTALLLSILKVDRETITQEYLLSNYYRRAKLEKIISKVKIAKLVKTRIELQAIQNFMSVDERYLNAAFTEIDAKYGGIDLFIQNQLGIDDVQRALIIKKLTY
ncbi:tyrosine-protein phosphatase [Flavobacterium subsaxonicum]|uniref:Protein tyrosine phosphatase n=1 Tax=Flavobacterium subsaxonicum WB 4.1-42 = DSM 21790 TaxID=1121898 RepID=A0A0A2MQ27_9FLAO|nr:tyrosine-protein phosphatase [Flavobacterium subsaxonicum]KGO94767.1 protein tyrosine phosphatase [Flavobacterium subsaxonicum WB 4.1-42 = DSM 21790]